MNTDLQERLLDNGWLHFPNCSEAILNQWIPLLGEVILTTDVVVKPEGKALVTSTRGLDYHTDHHRARYVAWYCHRQTDAGGETLLVDAHAAYQQLPLTYQLALRDIWLLEHKVFPEDVEHHPLISDLNGHLHFYYSFWLVNDSDRQHPALRAFQSALRNTGTQTLLLQPEDVLIIDNHRILHGRNPILGSTDRYLKRYWIATY